MVVTEGEEEVGIGGAGNRIEEAIQPTLGADDELATLARGVAAMQLASFEPTSREVGDEAGVEPGEHGAAVVVPLREHDGKRAAMVFDQEQAAITIAEMDVESTEPEHAERPGETFQGNLELDLAQSLAVLTLDETLDTQRMLVSPLKA